MLSICFIQISELPVYPGGLILWIFIFFALVAAAAVERIHGAF
jgi:hypothetical protein